MAVEIAEHADDPDKLIGEILANRYQIETRLGAGAMGTVYRARHVKVGRAFAVKVLHPRLLEDAKISQRFDREAELAGRLRHPNVIGVVDVGETPGGLRYMVMDFAEGEDLAAMLDQAPMPPERIIHLTRQLLEGLYHAHEQGLIHRDFKPENVIIETDMHGKEVPRIVDFGIAILREGGDSPNGQGRLTTNGLVLGTPHYMAPEQAVADPIDHRIDLFALGIVIYEMLCGKLPFDGTGAEVARANLLLDPPTIAQRVPYLEVDPLLEAFSRRLMAKKREHRPATAKAARELLDLIEKDRDAAAAALGVPLPASQRVPAVTAPIAPQRHGVQGPNDTFPPPIAAAAEPAVPPAAIETKVPRGVSTELTDPLDYEGGPKARRRRLAMFGGLGLALAGGLATFALTRGGDDTPAAPTPVEDKVVMQPAPAEPPAEPVAVAKEPPAPPPATPPPVEDVAPPETAAPEVKKPVATAKPAAKKDAAKLVPRGTTAKTEGKADVKAEVKAPDETAAKSDAAAIAARYSSVGQKLKALGPAATDLWPRYRLIRIQEVMASPEKRADASQILGKLEAEIRALQK
ncbi:MAG: serine/threonine protein kinase [Myxococcales bacterium]|nr:serine/threonine protein kinase [Myxococcales bacterium]